MKRVKGIRQKQGANYSDFVPLGTDGQFIDMFSELNLEYELKLGVKHIASITVLDENTTQIIEHYATPSEVNTVGKSFYSIKTIIDSTSEIIDTTTTKTNAVDSYLYWSTVEVGPIITQVFIKGKHTDIFEIEVEDESGTTIYNYDIQESYFEEE